jgi:hypothetical protein
VTIIGEEGLPTGADGLIIPIFTPPETARELDRIAEGVERVGAGAERVKGSWDRFSSAIESSSRAYLTVTGAASDFFGRVEAGAQRVAALADEQHRLDSLSERLGLNFDEAAGAAGRFADETEAAGAASQFLQRDVRLTQGELNALERVAGAASQTLGVTTAEATQRLTQSLITGRRQGLAVFGEGLAELAGPAHTVGERLSELVEQAGRVQPASDNASDSLARFKDSIEDSERTFATAFVDGLSRLSLVASGTQDASAATTDWNANLRALGDTAAEIALRVGHGVAAIAGAIATVVAGAANGIAALGAGVSAALSGRDPRAAMRETLSSTPTFDAIAQFTADRAASLERLSDEGDARTSMAPPAAARAGGASDAGRSTARTGGRGGRGGRRGADMVFSRDDAALGEGGERYDRGLRDSAARDLASGRAGEREVVDALLGAARDDEEAAGREFDAQRERAINEQRLADLDTFTGRWRALHNEQTSIARSAAETISKTFEALGESVSKHIEAVVAGQETAGEALKGILSDGLSALSKDAYAKAAMYVAESLGLLVSGNLPGAGTAAGAAVAYGVAGAATGAAAAALGGSGGSAAAASSASSAPRSGSVAGSAQSSSEERAPATVHHYYAPVIGGRSATDHELGSRLDRYDRASSDRQRREQD